MTVSSHRRLGGGLDAILGAVNANSSDELLENSKQEFKKIMVNQLVPGQYQPRRQFDQKALEELSLSISKQGIIQPIVVRKINMSEYEIIAGERRWRAAQMAGLQQVPVIICNVTDESALAFSLIENIQRQDLNPIEEAVALKRLVEEFKMTHEQVAESVGRSRSMVTNMLRLLNLVPSVQQLLVEKKLDIGHARLLLVFSKDDQKEESSLPQNYRVQPFHLLPRPEEFLEAQIECKRFIERTSSNWWDEDDEQSHFRDYYMCQVEGQIIYAFKDYKGKWFKHGLFS